MSDRDRDLVRCPNCKGKGHVFMAVSVLCPFLWPLALFEGNDRDGVTRDECSHCDGTGYVYRRASR